MYGFSAVTRPIECSTSSRQRASLASDIAEFDKWKFQFDDFLKSGDLNPGFIIYKRYLDRVKSRLDFALAELNKGVDSLDFNAKETLEIDRKDAPWLKTEAELNDLWRKRIKDEVLRLKIAGKEPAKIQELLTKRYKNQLSRLDQTRSEDIFQAYINTFAMSYDPHTNYLSPDNAENFDINMSLSLEGIGAVLQSDNDQVKIVRLVPAGPADKTKQVAPADKIIGVGTMPWAVRTNSGSLRPARVSWPGAWLGSYLPVSTPRASGL